jgi:excisionase family DNA binding protein
MEKSAAFMRGILADALQAVQKANESLASLVRALYETELREEAAPAPAPVREAPKEIMTVAEAAQYCGYTKGSLYVMAHKRKIPYHKPAGGRVVFFREELDKFLRRGRVRADYEALEESAAILNGERRRRRNRREHTGN